MGSGGRAIGVLVTMVMLHGSSSLGASPEACIPLWSFWVSEERRKARWTVRSERLHELRESKSQNLFYWPHGARTKNTPWGKDREDVKPWADAGGPFPPLWRSSATESCWVDGIEEKRKGTQAGWRWVGVHGWHMLWQFNTLQSHQSDWGSRSGLVGEDCAVPIPVRLLQLSLVCASDDSCGGSLEVIGDMI